MWIDLCVFGIVDIKTQANYQLMDDNFVGLIFSCFNEDPQDKVFHIWITLYLYNWYGLFVHLSNQLGLRDLYCLPKKIYGQYRLFWAYRNIY